VIHSPRYRWDGVALRQERALWKDLYQKLKECNFIDGVRVLYISAEDEVAEKFHTEPGILLWWLKDRLSKTNTDVLIIHSNLFISSGDVLRRLWDRHIDPGVDIVIGGRKPLHHPILYRLYASQGNVYAFNLGPAVKGPWRPDPKTGYLVSSRDGRLLTNRQDFPEYLYVDTSIMLIRKGLWSSLGSRDIKLQIVAFSEDELILIDSLETFLRAMVRYKRQYMAKELVG
jgi:hypothetical protein